MVETKIENNKKALEIIFKTSKEKKDSNKIKLMATYY